MKVTILRQSNGHWEYANLLDELPAEYVRAGNKKCTVTVTEVTAPILWAYYKDRGNLSQRYLMAAWLVSRGMPCADEAQVKEPVIIRFKPPVGEDDVAAFEAIRWRIAHTITAGSATRYLFTVTTPDAALWLWKFCRRVCHMASADRLYVYLLAHGWDAYHRGVTWDSHISEVNISAQTRFACEKHGINTLRDFSRRKDSLNTFEAEEVQEALEGYPSLDEQ